MISDSLLLLICVIILVVVFVAGSVTGWWITMLVIARNPENFMAALERGIRRRDGRG